MTDLTFHIEGVSAAPFAAVPQLTFRLRISQRDGVVVHTLVLRCQVEIEPTRRRYTADEQERLVELFGEPEHWPDTPRALVWAQTGMVVPAFQGETLVDLPVPCTFDFNVAATRYFQTFETGDLPLRFLFNGTVFYESTAREVQVAPIPWDRESTFHMPVEAWRTVMDSYYPNTAWLSLRRDVLMRLLDFRMREGLRTWEHAVERLLGQAEQEEKVVP